MIFCLWWRNKFGLYILCKFVCYFYAKCVINIEACTYCVNLCATFTQNVWFALFWRKSGHFKEFTLFCRKLAIVAIHAFFCVKFLLPKLWSRKFFDKYHVCLCSIFIISLEWSYPKLLRLVLPQKVLSVEDGKISAKKVKVKVETSHFLCT